MFSSLSAWLLATLLAQSPADTRAMLIEKVPASAAVVISSRPLDAVQADFQAMLRAMSPNLGSQAGPMLQLTIAQMSAQFGPEATRSPFTVALALPKTDGDEPRFAVLVPLDDYKAVVKSLTGSADSPKLESVGNGVDKLTTKDGEILYAYDGEGFMAFAPGSDEMVKAIAAKPTALATKLTPELRESLLGGDLGIYVDVAAVDTRYQGQIDAAREQFMIALDQAGDQMQQKDQMEQAKQLYGALFDSLKQGDGLALNLDFDKEALDLTSFLSLKASSPAWATLKNSKVSSTGASLGSLPPGYLIYSFMNTDNRSMEGLMKMNLGSMFPGAGANGPEAKKYLDAMMAIGQQENFSAMSMGGGMDVLSVIYPENVEKATEAMVEMMKAMVSAPTIKEGKVEEKVETYKGFTLNKATIQFDFDKMLGEQAGNPGATATLNAMFGADPTMTTYFGTDGKRLISVTAKTVEDIRKKIDLLDQQGTGIGITPGFQTLRKRLPERTNAIMALNAQKLVAMIGHILGTATGGAPIAPPADMPTDLALIGGAFTTNPTGYRVDLVIPSNVGPVLERGLTPIVQGLQGQINQ